MCYKKQFVIRNFTCVGFLKNKGLTMGKPYKSGQQELLFRMIINFDAVKQQQEAIIAEKRQCLHCIKSLADTMGDKVKMQELDSSTQENLMDLFKGHQNFARFGDIGCIIPVGYKEDADNYRNMVIRPDDVWVVTFPRSGTTFTAELVWLLMNDFDYDTASKVSLMIRNIFLERRHVVPEAYKKDIDSKMLPTYAAIANAPSPRCMKTHMPFSLMPTNFLDIAKVVYVGRDPRDVAVSYYHHNRLIMNYSGDFKTYWNLFINDLVIHAPFFPHLKEAWELRDHPNMLFIFYEDMTQDLPSAVKRIAKFLNKNITDEEVTKLSVHLDINNFRKNESCNLSLKSKFGNPDADSFVRKGKSGGWRDYFDEEMTAQAQKWMRENLAGSDLRFPDTTTSKVPTL